MDDIFDEIETISENQKRINKSLELVEKLTEIKIGLENLKSQLIDGGIKEDSVLISSINTLINKTK